VLTDRLFVGVWSWGSLWMECGTTSAQWWMAAVALKSAGIADDGRIY
jgi:hypothetical protein